MWQNYKVDIIVTCQLSSWDRQEYDAQTRGYATWLQIVSAQSRESRLVPVWDQEPE